MNRNLKSFWNIPAVDLIQRLETSSRGLASDEAGKRLRILGPNRLKPKKNTGSLSLLLEQFKSPIILILINIGQAAFSGGYRGIISK
jgi:Mg2+-importing ATPase